MVNKLKPLLNWNDLFKVRIREMTDAQTKHLVVKAILAQQLLIKHKKDKNYLRIYTEFPIKVGKVCDLYYENCKEKTAIAYEIQDKVTPQWIKETTETYNGWEVNNCRTSWSLIDLNKLSDNIEEMRNQIKELIV